MSVAGRNAAYNRDFGKALPGGELKPMMDGFHVVLRCNECRRDVRALHMKAKMPPEIIVKKLRLAGWDIGKKVHVCPNHERIKPVQTTDKITAPAEPVLPGVSASDKAKTARRETIMLLDDVFDVANGRYRGDESDATVAKTVGLAPEAVAKLREEFYGSIKVPAELEKLRDDCEFLRGNIEKSHGELTRVIANLSAGLADLTSRVEAAIRKFS